MIITTDIDLHPALKGLDKQQKKQVLSLATHLYGLACPSYKYACYGLLACAIGAMGLGAYFGVLLKLLPFSGLMAVAVFLIQDQATTEICKRIEKARKTLCL